MKTIVILAAIASSIILALNPPWKIVTPMQTRPYGHNWRWNTGDPYNTYTQHFDKVTKRLVYPEIDNSRLVLYLAIINGSAIALLITLSPRS